MHRLRLLLCAFLLISAPALPRQEMGACGTDREKTSETLFLHRQSVRARARTRLAQPVAPAVARDIGNIALIEDADGVVARQNQFNLDGVTLRFAPSKPIAAAYRYEVGAATYDDAAAGSGTPLGLGDDDSQLVNLPFAFPFFGQTWRQVWVNSDGNLTFGAADHQSSERSLGRMTAGPPRISPLFDDLDPSRVPGSVRVLATAAQFTLTWRGVPEYSSGGGGRLQTVQANLYPDGRIEFAYAGAAPSSAVVGIAPGGLQGSTALVSFRNDPPAEYAAAVVERFGDTLAIDVVTVAQKFYETHDDAYDYLVIYNTLDVPAGPTAVAYENTVRNNRSGYGDQPADVGAAYGSASRLQAVLNLGPLSQYPVDPEALVPARRAAGDTPLSIIGHEVGHLFLAFASVRDLADVEHPPMLGAQLAHWSFLFNSEASLLEGERIRDEGAAARPRFTTTDTVQGYAPLDQYLMGFRAASEVAPSFYVSGPGRFYAQLHPLRGFTFDGDRVDVSVDDVIAANGRRVPDHTVAQRRFRFAFIVVVAKGATPPAAELAQVEAYRSRFEPYYSQAASGRATADATLKRSLKLSLFPAAGVLEGGSATATLTVAAASRTDLTVALQTQNGNAKLPASVVIPAGSTSASFTLSGLRAGVEEVTAVPSDAGYETAFARVQVAGFEALKLTAVASDPVLVRVTDGNDLPYPGLRLTATPSAGGSVAAAAVVTDANGQAAFRWTHGSAPAAELRIVAEAAPSLTLTLHAGAAVAAVADVVSAASFAPGLAVGGLGVVRGVNLAGGTSATAAASWPDSLAGVRVLLDGHALPLRAVSDQRIDFYVPADFPIPASVASLPATLVVQPPAGPAASAPVDLAQLAPAIFSDGAGAIATVKAGDYVEIYCTGLGPTIASGERAVTAYQPTVTIGGLPATVVYSGLTSTPGVYQVNARVPISVGKGAQPVVVQVGNRTSNEVKLGVE